MVIRLILKYLGNNEQLVQRLSESYPMQQAARFVVRVFNRGKSVVESSDLKDKIDPTKITEFARKFTSNIKEEIQQAKEELKKRK